MHSKGHGEDWGRVIREMIDHSTETAPTVPGVYKMPCGECIVDFFVTADGEQQWLVAGDEHAYTRETIAIARHGDHPWERLYTLGDAAVELERVADELTNHPGGAVEKLAPAIDDVKP